ncbi:2-keto-4-pentenoate hydratase [Chitinimonas sp. BJYL2]|uniref:2-keto-4-pentenoate hydratase n=1 Tax=Chitinimonas sp. BJYL2 TaxID=2976696 RepID=UPI0022B57AF1|nr:2-keto-4-pentenoate hydratase [Chitinimonas sp. BJYL2]
MPLSPAAVLEAAQLLTARHQTGEQGPLLPDHCRPTDIADALAIQRAVADVLGDTIGGYKCGMPAADKLIIAPIYTRTIHRQSPCPVWARKGSLRIEPELAFVLGADLPPRNAPYTATDVDAAIASTHLALELIDNRYDDTAIVDYLDKLADGLVNQGLLLGPKIDNRIGQSLEQVAVTLQSGHAAQAFAGQHPAGLPRAPLYWLAEHLRSAGIGLKAGQAVITGSYAGAPTVCATASLRVQFGDIGEISVHFAQR